MCQYLVKIIKIQCDCQNYVNVVGVFFTAAVGVIGVVVMKVHSFSNCSSYASCFVYAFIAGVDLIKRF